MPHDPRGRIAYGVQPGDWLVLFIQHLCMLVGGKPAVGPDIARIDRHRVERCRAQRCEVRVWCDLGIAVITVISAGTASKFTVNALAGVCIESLERGQERR